MKFKHNVLFTKSQMFVLNLPADDTKSKPYILFHNLIFEVRFIFLK